MSRDSPSPTVPEDRSTSLDTGSRILLKLFILGPLAILAVFLFFLGPLGWMVLVTLVFAGMCVQATRMHGKEDTQRERRTSCPACGAPNDAGNERCQYCEEPLSSQGA